MESSIVRSLYEGGEDLPWRYSIHRHFISMATTYTSVSPLFIFMMHFASAISSPVVAPSTPKPRRLVTKLIFQESVLHPFYNPNDTIAHRAEQWMESTGQRLAYLFRKSDIQSNLFPTRDPRPMLFVKFSIGQPPVPQLAIMDSGSSLLWVKCAPCTGCSEKRGPVLDPSKSSTLTNLSCHSDICDGKCNSLDQCVYQLDYINGPSTKGILATEQLIFETGDEGKVVVPNVVFGCGHKNGHYPDERFSGVFGLGYGKTSMATQLGSKFSYCLGNLTDPHYSYSKLVLGDGADVEGYSTPLEMASGHYYVSLEGMSVGDKRLDIDPIIFERTGPWRGVMIDSGTSPTWLADDAYQALHDEVDGLLSRFLTQYGDHPLLCYEGLVRQDLVGFPVVTFHFAGGADLVLDTESLFSQVTQTVFCMNVRQSSSMGDVYKYFSIIGLMAQQYYNVAYDLVRSRLFFQRIDCELLDE